MAQRSVIEETFRIIAPKRRGTPATPTLSANFNTAGGDLSTSLSQAAAEISQLRAAWQRQADLIAANTSALRGSGGSGTGGSGSGNVVSQATHGILGGAFSFLSPVAKGLLGLFGGGGSNSSNPASLPVYVPPPPISLSGVLHGEQRQNTTPAAGTAAAPPPAAPSASAATQITVNISAMDGQSFLDRSTDIANAVRHAMLNLHPINEVVADL